MEKDQDMFNKSVSEFLKFVGTKGLNQVPSLVQAKNYKLFSILVLKDKVLVPSGYVLQDLLQQGSKMSHTVDKDQFFDWKHNDSKIIDVNIHAMELPFLESIFGIHIVSHDIINEQKEFRGIRKDEASRQELDQMENLDVDVEHDFFKKKENLRSMYLVTGVFVPTSGSTIKYGLNIDVDGGLGGESLKESDHSKGAGKVDVKYKKTRTLTFSGIPLGFEAHQLTVDKLGKIKLDMTKCA